MVRKLKVTKQPVKVPWYERPPLLFGGIAALLLVTGILMATITTRSSKPATVLGQGQSAAPAQGEVAAQASAAEHLLAPDAPLPPLVSGACGPVLSVETRQDAAAVRARLRSARALAPLAPGGDRAGAFHANVGIENLVAAAAQGGAAQAWGRLDLRSEFNPLTDIELHRDAQGCVYVAGFVSREVGEALGALGPDLPLAQAPVVAQPPAWQFWKKAAAPGPFALYQGSTIAIFPELSPEAVCYVVLPLERARPKGVRTLRAALERPQHVLEAVLEP